MSLLFATSIVPITANRVFPNIHQTVTNDVEVSGVGVEASLGADSEVQLTFHMPPTLPSGTGKLMCRAIANATSGNAKINPKWKSFAAEETIDLAVGSFNAETTSTVTWSTGDADVFKDTKITLDADTLVAGEIVIIRFVFESTSWTLAAVSTWQFYILWE